MKRRDFLKLATSVPLITLFPYFPSNAYITDFISAFRLTGIGESSSMASIGILRGSIPLIQQSINAWGGEVYWYPHPGDEIVWTDDINIEVKGLAIADIVRKDKVERYSPYGLISSTPIQRPT